MVPSSSGPTHEGAVFAVKQRRQIALEFGTTELIDIKRRWVSEEELDKDIVVVVVMIVVLSLGIKTMAKLQNVDTIETNREGPSHITAKLQEETRLRWRARRNEVFVFQVYNAKALRASAAFFGMSRSRGSTALVSGRHTDHHASVKGQSSVYLKAQVKRGHGNLGGVTHVN